MSKEETIEHLFRMHYGAMFRLAVAMLHDSDEAKDAVSEVFARLFRDNTHLPKKGTSGYLLVSVDIIRQKQMRERVNKLLTTETEPDLSHVQHQIDRYMALLAFADSKLTSQTRTVFRLRFNQRLSYKAIAEQTGISEAAVYKHLAQAIKKMKEQFNPNQK